MANWDTVSSVVDDSQGGTSPWDAVSSPILDSQASMPISPLLNNIGQDIGTRFQNFRNLAQQGGTNPSISTNLQEVGQLAGVVPDIIGNIGGSSLRGYEDLASQIAPQTTQAISSGIGAAKDYIANSPVGNLLKEGAGGIGELAKKYPQTTANIGAVGNIAAAVPVLGAAGEAIAPTLGKAGLALNEMAAAQTAARHNAFVQDLVSPFVTKKEAEKQVGNSIETGGLLNKTVSVPTPREQAIASEVAKVPGVSISKTHQGNYNVIKNEIGTEANKLQTTLENQKIAPSLNVYDQKPVFYSHLESSLNKISPTITGNAKDVAFELVNKMKALTKKNGLDPAGLLQSRKDLDAWVESQKGGKAFDPAQENALSVALRTVRQATNNFIDSEVSDVGVKASLQKQNLLYDALDNIKPKVAREGKNRVIRATQSISKAIPLKGEVSKLATVTAGLAGIGTTGVLAPAVAGGILGTGLAGYGTYKALTSPLLKNFAGNGLIGLSNILK